MLPADELAAVEVDNIKYYYNPAWQAIKHGIFTRQGGYSREPWGGLNVGGTVGDDLQVVRSNHSLIYDKLGMNQSRSCTTWQVHGADVVVATGPVSGRRWLAQADGMVTNLPDTPLFMRYADCTPLLFYDPENSAIGIAHAGWRGTVQGIATNMVQTMQSIYGTQPARLQVIIGPSISCEKFQVGQEVVDALEDYFGTLDGLMRRDPADGTAYVDLWAANELALRRCGVENVTVSGICTYQNTDEFFSHRAENGRTGRFGAAISL